MKKVKNITSMTKGKVEKAERIALNIFDKWNEVTSFVKEDTGYYYELLAIIEDAVHVGIQTALFGKVSFDENGDIIKEINDIKSGK